MHIKAKGKGEETSASMETIAGVESFRLGQCVRVRDGVRATEQPEVCIGGWQGRVRSGVFKERGTGRMLVTVYWDAPTIRALPQAYLDQAQAKKRQPHCETIHADELEPAEPRDTPAQSCLAYSDLGCFGRWGNAGDSGRRIIEVVANHFFLTDDYGLRAWEAYLSAHVRYPFQATVEEETPELCEGDEVMVHGIATAEDDHDGVLITVSPLEEKNRTLIIPLVASQPDHFSPEEDAVFSDYWLWFKYRNAQEALLTPKEILRQLAGNESSQFPHHIVEQAQWHQEELTAEFLTLLTRVRDENGAFIAKPEYVDQGKLLLYALFLLAYWQETRAYPVLCDLMEVSPAAFDAISDPAWTCDLGRILASVCGGDTSRIERLAGNRAAHTTARTQAVMAWLALFYTERKPRDEVVAFCRRLFSGGLERKPSRIWNALVEVCAYLQMKELQSEIADAFTSELVDADLTNEEWVSEIMSLPPAEAQTEALDMLGSPFVNHPAFELDEGEEDFEEDEDWGGCDWGDDSPFFRPGRSDFPEEAAIETFVREEPKVNRNDPCPCGSGQKHKKCCGRGK